MTCSYNRDVDPRRETAAQVSSSATGISDAGGDDPSPSASMSSQSATQLTTGDSDMPAVATYGDSPGDWVSPVDSTSDANTNHMLRVEDLTAVNDYSWSFDIASLPLLPPFFIEGAADFMMEEFDTQGNETAAQPLSEPISSSLSLEQLDPLLAKCTAIKALLQGPGPMVPEEVVVRSINRDSLLQALQLFGRNFQRHIPFLHAPTFDLTTSSPILVLAMFVAGACYTDLVRPAKYLYPMARRVLVHIERQQHEIDLTDPPLSSIQAGIVACAVLGSSQDETAHNVTPFYFTRNVSMARRAAIFDMSPVVDYRTLTKQTFDWHSWVERETRNRIANTLFCQDMAGCIFMGKAPAFAPLDLDIELPSYEICWNARSAAACLQHLQSTPPQRKLSSTLSQLRIQSPPLEPHASLEVSAFGMFTLVKALHCLVWQATHHDLDRDLAVRSRDFSPASMLVNLDHQVAGDFSGPNIVQLTTRVLGLRDSSTFASINQVLDEWLAIWERRTWRDTEFENLAFSLDPLPFWWLAKLFILLHCGRDYFSADSEFAIVNKSAGSVKDSRALQATVFRWLVRLRQRKSADQVEDVDSLAGLMAPM